ncbi:MAG: DUF4139 domain-containing protein [Thermodesulfobacteriota bacterium]
MRGGKWWWGVALAAWAAGTGTAASQESVSSLDDQQRVAVTIYNDNLALVRDTRVARLHPGQNRLLIREVSARIRPETALLRGVSPGISLAVSEQNFDFDLLTPQRLLQEYVGRTIQVARPQPGSGEEEWEEAVVLAATDGPVLRIGERIETGWSGRLAFPSLPGNLRDRPTLATTVETDSEAPQLFQLSYLTEGLSWQADYVAELSANDDRLQLHGWVTLTNTSGVSYRNASVQLVAGDVHQATAAMERSVRLLDDVPLHQGVAPGSAQEGLFEYYLYRLGRPTTMAESQTKQVSLLQVSDVTCTKEYVLTGDDFYYRRAVGDLGQQLKVGVVLEVGNLADNHLGLPLPRGAVRVYKQDQQEALQFLGEDLIDHVAEHEVMHIKVGESFDVTASKRQTDFEKLSGFGKYNYVFDSSYEIEIKNVKNQKVTVKVLEPMPGDWEVVEESLTHTKGDSNTALWRLQVPARTTKTLTYRVRVRY